MFQKTSNHDQEQCSAFIIVTQCSNAVPLWCLNSGMFLQMIDKHH